MWLIQSNSLFSIVFFCQNSSHSPRMIILNSFIISKYPIGNYVLYWKIDYVKSIHLILTLINLFLHIGMLTLFSKYEFFPVTAANNISPSELFTICQSFLFSIRHVVRHNTAEVKIIYFSRQRTMRTTLSYRIVLITQS